MATRQQLQGKWNEVKGRLKERWGQLTDDDLVRGEGNVEQLVGVIQQKTGRAREEVEKFIDEVVEGSSNTMDRVASAAREYAGDASEAMRRGYDQASDTVKRGYEQASQKFSEGYQTAEETVRRNPMESVAVSFGAGIVAGVLVGLMLKRS
jgi:uncharacterized protein YjbJ (UPF0337 family)